MTFQLCRGPLPEGHPNKDFVYFCPDADVPLAASGLQTTPVLSTFQFTPKNAVLLEAHRAPDEWFTEACRMPNLLLQGDPDAYRPRSCSLFAAELCKQEPRPITNKPHVQCTPTLTAALPLTQGKTIVLCGTYQVRDAVFSHIRPNGIQKGDGVVDNFGRFTVVHKLMHSNFIEVDGGRKIVRKDTVTQHITVSPSTVRSGEYDTIIVMPDVPESIARAICRRARYLIIGVMHSPLAYVPQ